MKYVIATLICSVLFSVRSAGEQQDTVLMPEGFDKIHLGMDWASLILLRPDAEIMNMMPNPNADLKPNSQKPMPGLVERLGSDAFERVIYVFEDGVLVAIMFGGEAFGSSAVERKSLMGRVAAKRGMPTRIGIMEKEEDMGILTWEDQSTLVNVIAPVNSKKTKRGVLGLQVMDKKYAERIHALGLSVKKPAKVERARVDEERIDALEAEVRGLLSSMNENEKQ